MLKVISGILKEQLETKLVMKTLGGIVEPNRFEPCASDSEKEGGSVCEDENPWSRVHFSSVGLDVPFNRRYIGEGFCII